MLSPLNLFIAVVIVSVGRVALNAISLHGKQRLYLNDRRDGIAADMQQMNLASQTITSDQSEALLPQKEPQQLEPSQGNNMIHMIHTTASLSNLTIS